MSPPLATPLVVLSGINSQEGESMLSEQTWKMAAKRCVAVLKRCWLQNHGVLETYGRYGMLATDVIFSETALH